MTKLSTLLAALGLSVMAGTAAFAQAAPSAPAVGVPAAAKADRMAAALDRRIEKIRADLKLTEQQKPLFGAVEQVLRKQAADRHALMAADRAQARGDVLQMLDHQARMSELRAAQARDLSNALKPLWATLDPAQKKSLADDMRPHRAGPPSRG